MPFRDRHQPVKVRIAALLAAARTRADWKRLGEWLDGEGTELRAPLLAEARERGIDLEEGALAWPGKRLLRRARGVEEVARERKNPIRRDEGFTCVHCGRAVPVGGATVRDHCPWCLRSRHVDRVPGDRASACGGVMDPVGLELGGRAEAVIHYRCRVCGGEHRNRAALDADPPDDHEALCGLAALGERWVVTTPGLGG
jgi:predicted RNA-binding Zn-ribbon protein involved in translation (DUF1610 family)